MLKFIDNIFKVMETAGFSKVDQRRYILQHQVLCEIFDIMKIEIVEKIEEEKICMFLDQEAQRVSTKS